MRDGLPAPRAADERNELQRQPRRHEEREARDRPHDAAVAVAAEVGQQRGKRHQAERAQGQRDRTGQRKSPRRPLHERRENCERERQERQRLQKRRVDDQQRVERAQGRTPPQRRDKRRVHPHRHVHDAAAPAAALAERYGEVVRRFVVGQRTGDKADAHAVCRALRGKLRVLGDGRGVPAAEALKHRAVDGKARADQLGGKAAAHAGAGEESVEEREVQPIAAGKPGVVGILRAHRALAHLRPRAEGVVHAGEESLVRDVVRVKDAEGVIALRQQPRDRLVQRVALAAHRLKAAEDLRARAEGLRLGVIRAVVGDHKNIVERVGIVLLFQALHERADDSLLVARSNEAGKARARRAHRIALRLSQRKERHGKEPQARRLQQQR